MKRTHAPRTPSSRPAGAAPPPRDDAPLQGEGNYEAARRHRESLKRFLDADKVEAAAKAAAPKNDEEKREMKAAQSSGLSHGRH